MESCSAVVGPASAVAKVLSACWRLASACCSVLPADVGSIFASTCPAFTLSPTATSRDVNAPLVVKSADADVATPTLPLALTLDWTVPSVTVAVRWEPAADDEPLKNP